MLVVDSVISSLWEENFRKISWFLIHFLPVVSFTERRLACDVICSDCYCGQCKKREVWLLLSGSNWHGKSFLSVVNLNRIKSFVVPRNRIIPNTAEKKYQSLSIKVSTHTHTQRTRKMYRQYSKSLNKGCRDNAKFPPAYRPVWLLQDIWRMLQTAELGQYQIQS